MKSKLILCIALTALAITSCDDNTSYLGSTLTNKLDSLNISADTFEVTTRSIIADSVLSRNSVGYLGRIKDPETGAYITGDFMTQFHTMENYDFPKEDSITSRDANNEIIADSTEIRLYYTSYFGDSLNAMKLTTYEMATPVEEGNLYYSNFDPQSSGMVKSDGIHKQKVFTINDLSVRDSIRTLSTYTKNIRIVINEPYTKDGVTYHNYGTYLMKSYYKNKNYYKNSYNFIHNLCPGFYFKINNGLGSMAYISVSQLNVYFRYISSDSIYSGIASFGGTEEVLQTTKITNDTKTINKLAADSTCTYIKSPAGIFTEMSIPIDNIMKGHENDTLNTAKVVLTRINNNTQSKYELGIPKTLLIIPKDSLYSFFENSDIANSKTSYITTYSSTYNTYTFANISGLIAYIYAKKTKGVADNSNWVAQHPDWNKFVIIPVTTTYNSSSELTKVVHDMSLTSTRLVGGSDNKHDPIKINVIYSKFNAK